MGYPIGLSARAELRVNGTLLGEDVMRLVSGVVVEMDVDRADSLSVGVDPTADLPSRKLLDAYVFAEGNVLEVALGYDRSTATSLGVFDLQPPGGRGGRSGVSYSISGLAPVHRLLDNRLFRVFGADYTDAEIVEMLAREYGFVPRCSPTVRRTSARTKESGVSDFALLSYLAAEASNDAGEAFYWRAEWTQQAVGSQPATVLTFGPVVVRPPAERFTFRAEDSQGKPATVYEWSVQPSIKGIPTKLDLVWTDRATRTEMEAVVECGSVDSDPVVLWSGRAGRPTQPASGARQAAPEDPSRKGLDTIDREVADGSAVRFHASGLTPWGAAGAFASEQEALAWAKKFWSWLRLSLCEGEFEVPGVPTVRPWQVHDFVGMSDRWDGSYLLTSARHSLDRDGYKLRLKGRRLAGVGTDPAVSVLT